MKPEEGISFLFRLFFLQVLQTEIFFFYVTIRNSFIFRKFFHAYCSLFFYFFITFTQSYQSFTILMAITMRIKNFRDNFFLGGKFSLAKRENFSLKLFFSTDRDVIFQRTKTRENFKEIFCSLSSEIL